MKNIIIKNKIKFFLLVILFCLPIFTFAASIDVEKPQEGIKVNDTVILNVYINTDSKEINVIDGSIKISGNYEIKDLNTAGSVFSLWPNKPTISEGLIKFVGGTPVGVSGSKLKVFSIAIKPLDVNGITFYSENTNLFLNDGLGTTVTLSKMDKKIEVSNSTGESKNELEKTITEDKILPEDFEIIVGNDPSLFDGKYFASFNTVDNQSGLNRYEVSENGKDWTVSENTYLIKNQDLKGEIIVKAIDNAGNVRVVKNKLQNNTQQSGITLLLLSIFVVILIMYFVFKSLKRKSEKK